MKRIIVTSVLLITTLFVLYVWFYVYNKPHLNIHEEKVSFRGGAIELRKLYTLGDSTQSIVNNVVVINGNISDQEDSWIILDNQVICYLDSNVILNENWSHVVVKGLFHGAIDDIIYGELLVIDKGTILNIKQ